MNYRHIYLMRNELELTSAKFGLGERGRPGTAGGRRGIEPGCLGGIEATAYRPTKPASGGEPRSARSRSDTEAHETQPSLLPRVRIGPERTGTALRFFF